MSPSREPRERADPLIDEVREIRRAIEEGCGGDWERLGEYLRRVAEEHLMKTCRGTGSPHSGQPTDPQT